MCLDSPLGTGDAMGNSWWGAQPQVSDEVDFPQAKYADNNFPRVLLLL